MERLNLFCLHGFLGRPADWAPFCEEIAGKDRLRVFAPDYFNDNKLSPQNDFNQWAQNFSSWAKSQSSPESRNILIGYSLGGRLALHALEHAPSLWDKVILISVNPGFDDTFDGVDSRSAERQQRWMSDTYWADEFQKAPWETVIKNWNAQPVFGKDMREPPRVEKEYSRDILSLALTQWSLAQQRNMRPLLAQEVSRIHWLVGERDKKFLGLAQSLVHQIPSLSLQVVPTASHRVLFDNPQFLGEWFRRFCQKLS